MNIKPLGDRILVEPVKAEEVTKGKLIIPDVAKEKPLECIVKVLGTSKFQVKEGDRVLVSKYAGTEIKVDGIEYKVIGSEDIMAIVW